MNERSFWFFNRCKISAALIHPPPLSALDPNNWYQSGVFLISDLHPREMALQEGFSVFRPPLFNGLDYTYWKTRMRVFLISLNLDLWNIVENGFQLPSKPMYEWSDLEKKYFSLNAKAMNALFCALDKNEFNRISTCETAFDIWRTLEITHEGTSRVKDSKVNILLLDFELFHMKPSETVVDMYTRFTDVVNGLKSLGKSFSDFELVNKVLRSLSKTWDSKVTAIQESKNLNQFPLEELIGSLITYEMTCNAREELENHLPKNRKDLELWTNECHLSDDSSDEDNDEQNNLPKNRKDLGHRTFEDHSSISSSDGELKLQMKRKLKSKKNGTTCFKRKKKNKNWDESSSSEDEKVNKSEAANYALLAYDIEVIKMPLVYFEIT